MNQPTVWKNALLTTLLLLCTTIIGFAQDGKLLDIDVDINKGEWYEQPWVWAVAVGILVLGVLIGRRK